MNENNDLDPNTAFVSLTLFNMLRQPLNSLPRIIQGLTQVKKLVKHRINKIEKNLLIQIKKLQVSMTRIRKFLLLDEIQDEDVSHEDIQEYAINVENADFGWSRSESTLKK